MDQYYDFNYLPALKMTPMNLLPPALFDREKPIYEKATDFHMADAYNRGQPSAFNEKYVMIGDKIVKKDPASAIFHKIPYDKDRLYPKNSRVMTKQYQPDESTTAGLDNQLLNLYNNNIGRYIIPSNELNELIIDENNYVQNVNQQSLQINPDNISNYKALWRYILTQTNGEIFLSSCLIPTIGAITRISTDIAQQLDKSRRVIHITDIGSIDTGPGSKPTRDVINQVLGPARYLNIDAPDVNSRNIKSVLFDASVAQEHIPARILGFFRDNKAIKHIFIITSKVMPENPLDIIVSLGPDQFTENFDSNEETYYRIIGNYQPINNGFRPARNETGPETARNETAREMAETGTQTIADVGTQTNPEMAETGTQTDEQTQYPFIYVPNQSDYSPFRTPQIEDNYGTRAENLDFRTPARNLFPEEDEFQEAQTDADQDYHYPSNGFKNEKFDAIREAMMNYSIGQGPGNFARLMQATEDSIMLCLEYALLVSMASKVSDPGRLALKLLKDMVNSNTFGGTLSLKNIGMIVMLTQEKHTEEPVANQANILLQYTPGERIREYMFRLIETDEFALMLSNIYPFMQKTFFSEFNNEIFDALLDTYEVQDVSEFFNSLPDNIIDIARDGLTNEGKQQFDLVIRSHNMSRVPIQQDIDEEIAEGTQTIQELLQNMNSPLGSEDQDEAGPSEETQPLSQPTGDYFATSFLRLPNENGTNYTGEARIYTENDRVVAKLPSNMKAVSPTSYIPLDEKLRKQKDLTPYFTKWTKGTNWTMSPEIGFIAKDTDGDDKYFTLDSQKNPITEDLDARFKQVKYMPVGARLYNNRQPSKRTEQVYLENIRENTDYPITRLTNQARGSGLRKGGANDTETTQPIEPEQVSEPVSASESVIVSESGQASEDDIIYPDNDDLADVFDGSDPEDIHERPEEFNIYLRNPPDRALLYRFLPIQKIVKLYDNFQTVQGINCNVYLAQRV